MSYTVTYLLKSIAFMLVLIPFGVYCTHRWLNFLWYCVWSATPASLIKEPESWWSQLWMYGLWTILSYYFLVHSFGYPFSATIVLMAVSAYVRRGNDATPDV